MRDCPHLWLHMTTMAGNGIERCHHCRRVRLPRLTREASQANLMAAANLTFRGVFAGPISGLVQPLPAFTPKNGFGYA